MTDLYIKGKIIKVLKENTGENYGDLKLKNFFNKIQKAQKEKR